jgi:hypothetical protein
MDDAFKSFRAKRQMDIFVDIENKKDSKDLQK